MYKISLRYNRRWAHFYCQTETIKEADFLLSEHMKKYYEGVIYLPVRYSFINTV